ncbi:MAG: hypothetical protein IJ224_08940 [Lachnospiraceae bacterium]|nr:hypothetical protein [Lachnospiraceae bacterium]
MEKLFIDSMQFTPEICLKEEEEFERDRNYLTQMYPAKARLIMVLVEDACDRLEYEGSPMFAEYPDRETLRGIADRIYDKVKCKDDDDGLRHLIEVMLCNEFYARRCRYKRRRRFF